MAPLALSCGDPGGIGLDIVIDAWHRRREQSLPPFYLLADPAAITARAEAIGLPLPLAESDAHSTTEVFQNKLPVVPLVNRLEARPGRSNPANAAGIIEAIDRAVQDVTSGAAEAMVTLPIAKKPLHDAGFSFPGHTEYLGHLARQHTSKPATPVMMLAGPRLRAVPVTVHIGLARVPETLTQAAIEETCRITADDMRTRFGVAEPRLAVAGLNPHAGEDGAFGDEERNIIAPAIAALNAAGIDARGPIPADTMFHERARNDYDVAICMYHDQALIPAKALDFDLTVNVTLGLPFVRTSPDHGTAFDIAGTGKANPDSFIAALRMAASMAGRAHQAAS